MKKYTRIRETDINFRNLHLQLKLGEELVTLPPPGYATALCPPLPRSHFTVANETVKRSALDSVLPRVTRDCGTLGDPGGGGLSQNVLPQTHATPRKRQLDTSSTQHVATSHAIYSSAPVTHVTARMPCLHTVRQHVRTSTPACSRVGHKVTLFSTTLI